MEAVLAIIGGLGTASLAAVAVYLAIRWRGETAEVGRLRLVAKDAEVERHDAIRLAEAQKAGRQACEERNARLAATIEELRTTNRALNHELAKLATPESVGRAFDDSEVTPVEGVKPPPPRSRTSG